MSKWTSLCEILKTADEAKALAEQALSSGGTGIVVDGKPTEGSKNAVSSGGVYDAINSLAIKGNKSGAAVACDVSPIGHMMKVKARGKNILSPNYYHTTGRETNGITFTVDGNGLITANGEATGSAMFIMKYATNPVRLKIGEKYVLSGAPQGASVSTYYMTLSADDNSAFITDLGSGKAFTATRSSYTLIIYIENGTKAENLIFKPQIEEGSTATAYAPYIADITTANVTRCGKNLATAQQVYSGAGIYQELVEDGRNCIRFVDSVAWKPNTNLAFEENTQYTFSFWGKREIKQDNGYELSVFLKIYYTDGTSTVCFGASENKNTNSNTSQYIHMPFGDWVYCTYTSNAGKTIQRIEGSSFHFATWLYVDVDTFQIEEGANATEYEPCEPTTYPINADGTVEGVSSLYPTTTLMTDTEGIVLDVEYSRDINSAFAELQSIVNTLIGG